MYLNGEPVATNISVTIRPWQVLARNNFVGESQWAADPPFNGLIDSFRIHGRALSAAEIRDLAYAHPALAHRYSITEDARDSIGSAHGEVMGGAIMTNDALELTGTTGDYVDLPGGLLSGSANVSIEFWATFGSNDTEARVFTFGNMVGALGTQFLCYNPHTGAGNNRLRLNASATTVTSEGPGTLDGRTLHGVCIADPLAGYMAVYTNGILAHSKSAALPALGGVGTSWSFIGRSLYTAGSWLNASIHEFRIYDGRLTPAEIAANYEAGPDALALPVALNSVASAGSLTLSWPAYAVGFDSESSGDLGNPAAWTPTAQTPIKADDLWSVGVAMTNNVESFRLRR